MTESRIIAEYLEQFDVSYPKSMMAWWRDENHEEKITENITVTKSSMCWELWKRYPDQRRSFWKCVPIGNTSCIECVIAILDAQMWMCI